MIRRLSVAVTLLAVVAALGCDETKRRERESATDVAHAEETLRGVDNSAKVRVLGLLSVPCFGAEPCQVQRLCQAAYALHIEGLQLTRAASQRLDDGKPTEAAQLVGSAEQKLTQARPLVADCTDRAAALRRRYAH